MIYAYRSVAGFWDYVSDHWKQYLPNSETR